MIRQHSKTKHQTFHQWQRKSYAVFSILGKSVKIGVLAIIYVLSLAPLKAQTDTTEISKKQDYVLEEVEVKAERTPVSMAEAARQVTVISRKDIEAAGYNSLDQVLNRISEIDLRKRGPGDIQSDISINGSSFEQVMVMLNGINISDPQTGHFNADIPVPLSVIERVEIISGSASRVFGPNAYGGAVNIVTRKAEKPDLSVLAEYGQYNYRKADIFAGSRSGSFFYGGASQYTSTSGYRENTDSKNASVFLMAGLDKEKFNLFWLLGANMKKFGANSFYTPAYPDQYEETEALISSLSFSHDGRVKGKHDVYLRYHLDEFHLFRYSSPTWYSGPNNHLNSQYGSQHNIWIETPLGKSSIGANIRLENLWSTVLGDSLLQGETKVVDETVILNNGGFRQHLSFFAEQSWGNKRFHVSGGLMYHVLTGVSGGSFFYPGIDMSYRLSPNLKLYTGINKALRLPSFTEMYYSSPTHQGNRHLQPESAWEYQLGLKAIRYSWSFNTSLNARWSNNSIDWIRYSSEDKWVTANLTDLFSLGLNFILMLNEHIFEGLPPGFKSKFSYRYGYQEKTEAEFDSRYVMDYLKHKLGWQTQMRFLKSGFINLTLTLADRAGDYTDWDENGLAFQRDYKPFIITDLGISWKLKRTGFNISIDNLFNTQYADFAHVWMPGRIMKIGISYELIMDN